MVDTIERFYTDSTVDEELINYIAIDTVNKVYGLYYDVNSIVTDSIDEDGDYIDFVYVSEKTFKILVKGVKENNYKEK